MLGKNAWGCIFAFGHAWVDILLDWTNANKNSSSLKTRALMVISRSVIGRPLALALGIPLVRPVSSKVSFAQPGNVDPWPACKEEKFGP